MNDYLSKPVQFLALAKLVKQWIADQQVRGASNVTDVTPK
jgi:hypothetical protein